MEHCDVKVTSLQEKWEDLKKRMQIMERETEANLADLEKGNFFDFSDLISHLLEFIVNYLSFMKINCHAYNIV